GQSHGAEEVATGEHGDATPAVQVGAVAEELLDATERVLDRLALAAAESQDARTLGRAAQTVLQLDAVLLAGAVGRLELRVAGDDPAALAEGEQLGQRGLDVGCGCGPVPGPAALARRRPALCRHRTPSRGRPGSRTGSRRRGRSRASRESRS